MIMTAATGIPKGLGLGDMGLELYRVDPAFGRGVDEPQGVAEAAVVDGADLGDDVRGWHRRPVLNLDAERFRTAVDCGRSAPPGAQGEIAP